jgi:peptidoglycan/xylan/chitin deacetylase (PgdA/CDA1 family)
VVDEMDQPLLLTTSWDDADPADLRLAEILAVHGFRGTFYLCRDREGRARLTDAEISDLAAVPEVEIGSHTLTHSNLRQLSPRQVDVELKGSKSWLEDLIGSPVTSFCYPNGLHRRSLAGAVAATGYSVGRTTMSGHTELAFNPLLMPTTMQMYPHTQLTQLRHALKERDVRGFRNIVAMRSWSRWPVELAPRFIEQASGISREPVAIHIWGHSWELNDAGLWSALENLLKYLRDIGATPKTNKELAQFARTQRDVRA